MKKVLVIPADAGGCGHYRMSMPFGRIRNSGDIQFELLSDIMENDAMIGMIMLFNIVSNYDAVVFQRVASKSMCDLMEYCKTNGIKVFMDLDDDLFTVHSSNPAYAVWHKGSEATKQLSRAIELSDGILCSTDELLNAYRVRFPSKKYVVIENGVNIDSELFSQSRRDELPMDKVVVGWAGSTSHIDSLKEIVKPVEKLCSRNKNVLFALCSNKEFMDIYFKNIPQEQKVYIPHVKIDQWPRIMSMFDVSLATVKPSPFNACKSELKLIEAGVWGVPSVATKVAPYDRFRERSGNTTKTIYDNVVNDWVRAIEQYVKDENLRKEHGLIAKDTVYRHYDIDKINLKRIDFFKNELK